MDTESLRADLECITQIRPLADGETMATVLLRLDTVSKKPDLPARLEHYLSQRSYVKALAWLDDPEMPHQR